ncbi:MAG: HD-GYP domain-containing protein [Leptospiraceae bacterium]|nr:HD-GYP domain-containing protein [Leptospiraceae bacterium]MCP5500411.1 HD-GYP domain-containing protein [Leptospiraceae bacterium]
MKIALEKLRIGTILDGTLINEKGEIVLNERVVFTREIQKFFLKEKLTYLEYFPRAKEEYEKSDWEKREEDRLESLLTGYHRGIFSKESIRSCLSGLRNLTFSFLNNHEAIDFQSCSESILQIYDEIKQDSSTIINLLDLRNHDDYTFCHSVNVAIISLSLAQKMGYSDEEIKLIGLGGLLHDIGKIAVPSSLINKTSVLSEEEKRIMKSHPTHSYRIMKSDTHLNSRVINMAYEHHERYDGKGYPRGIMGDKLDDYSVIVALADVYDALTAVRSYKPAFSPEESIQVIETYTGTHFAPRIAEKFIHDIQTSLAKRAEYKKGSLVLLNTHEVAQVLYHKHHPDGAEIIVQILTDSKHERLQKPRKINLKIDRALKIKRALSRDEIDGETLRIRKVSSTNLSDE